VAGFAREQVLQPQQGQFGIAARPVDPGEQDRAIGGIAQVILAEEILGLIIVAAVIGGGGSISRGHRMAGRMGGRGQLRAGHLEQLGVLLGFQQEGQRGLQVGGVAGLVAQPIEQHFPREIRAAAGQVKLRQEAAPAGIGGSPGDPRPQLIEGGMRLAPVDKLGSLGDIVIPFTCAVGRPTAGQEQIGIADLGEMPVVFHEQPHAGGDGQPQSEHQRHAQKSEPAPVNARHRLFLARFEADRTPPHGIYSGVFGTEDR